MLQVGNLPAGVRLITLTVSTVIQSEYTFRVSIEGSLTTG